MSAINRPRKVFFSLLLLFVAIWPTGSSATLSSFSPKEGQVCYRFDPSVFLAITEASWSFDLDNQILSFSGTLTNISDGDVVGPGLTLIFLDSKERPFLRHIVYLEEARIEPGASSSIHTQFFMEQFPDTVLIRPFQVSGGT